jgi:hypothetical protein
MLSSFLAAHTAGMAFGRKDRRIFRVKLPELLSVVRAAHLLCLQISLRRKAGRTVALSRRLGLVGHCPLPVAIGHDQDELQRLPVPARDHPAGDLALSPVHLKLPGRRRSAG